MELMGLVLRFWVVGVNALAVSPPEACQGAIPVFHGSTADGCTEK